MENTTKLSVNINKFATLRNARGGNMPNILKVAADCERFGADGITVHPRPDERHIRYQDVLDLRPLITTEFNMEGYPSRQFLELALKVKPDQCTLVPDPPDALTSNTGWDTVKHQSFLKEVIGELKNAGIRVSICLNPETDKVTGAKSAGADRIELYTGPYAEAYEQAKTQPQNFKLYNDYKHTAAEAAKTGLELNAGHDLNLDNLRYFK